MHAPYVPGHGIPFSGLRHPCLPALLLVWLVLSCVTLWELPSARELSLSEGFLHPRLDQGESIQSRHSCVISGQFLKAKVQICLWEQKRPLL